MILALICSLGGCDGRRQAKDAAEAGSGPKSTADPSREETAAAKVSDYHLKGVVKKVDIDKKSVVIAHQEIPGFMSAMTMPFQVRGQDETLRDLKTEDEVEATLHVIEKDGVVSDYELRDLAVTKPAVSRMVISVSKGKVSLSEAPKLLDSGETVPDFAMTTEDGKPLKFKDLRGNVVALTFIYTRCPLPDFCPLMDRKFAELAASIAASPKRAQRIRLISLSFDPDHDTPDVLAKHAQIRGAARPLWTFAVASHEELAKIAPRLGLFYAPGSNEIAHNLCTAIIDPEGKLARLEVGTTRNKWENVDLLKTIYSLIPPAEKVGSQ